MSNHLFCEEILLNAQPEPPHPTGNCLGEDADHPLATVFFQVVEESDNITPEPPPG